jgi:hypothetical protein
MQRCMKIIVIALVFVSCMVGSGICRENESHDRGSGHSGSHEDKLYGIVEKIPANITGTWIVNGKEIHVTNKTFIKEEHGKAAVGAYVEVEGNYSGNTFTAVKIEVKRGHK